MRVSKVISITLPPELFREAAELAKKESRTMSELMREALRRYKRQQEWDAINAYGRGHAARLGISEDDVVRLVHQCRAEKRRKRRNRPRKAG